MGLVHYKWVFLYANEHLDIEDRFSGLCVSVSVSVCLTGSVPEGQREH